MTNPYRRFGVILGDIIWYTFLLGSAVGVGVISSSVISKIIRIAITKEAMRSITKKEEDYNADDSIE